MSVNGDVLIKVEGLKKSFGGFHALDGITEEIRKGEVVVIVGPSGSGKSTFLRSLNLLEVPTEGHIYFEGVDITDKKTDLDKHRQKMGMVFQHFNLFPHKTGAYQTAWNDQRRSGEKSYGSSETCRIAG